MDFSIPFHSIPPILKVHFSHQTRMQMLGNIHQTPCGKTLLFLDILRTQADQIDETLSRPREAFHGKKKYNRLFVNTPSNASNEQ